MDKNRSERTINAAVNKKKAVLFLGLAVIVELLLCFFVFPAQEVAEPVTLNLALYWFIPDYDSFEETVRELLSRVSDQNGDLKYLLCARSSVYDDMMVNYPIYKELKDIATVPVAYVFRIKPGGDGYLQEAQKNADLLPGLYK